MACGSHAVEIYPMYTVNRPQIQDALNSREVGF
uniref:Uncharacterized protein n=1 Tax=Anguilla anguilla TaxID=7936 RepID=A0A0E9QXP4_ANGAN